LQAVKTNQIAGASNAMKELPVIWINALLSKKKRPPKEAF